VPEDSPLLALRGVNKSFGPVHVLHDVDFNVYHGEVMSLVGDNGAGKSTLVKSVAGIHPIDSGEIIFEGESVTVHGPHDAALLGIEIVYQDLALCNNLDVVQNMFLGRELHTTGDRGLLNEDEMERKARATLAGLSVRTLKSVRQRVVSLSGGQRQSVAIAKAVLWNSKVVFLDEPTAALGVAQTRQVLDLVRRLADQGLGVVLISHNMNDVLEVSDRITALYLGRVAAEVRASEVKHGQIVELITAGRSGDIGLAQASVSTATI
jgi:D-xylose transport system ATP-binding protein